jgi:hypothetical protein
VDPLIWEIGLLRENLVGVWPEQGEFAIWAEGEVADEPGIG